jgi:hypothetical protein
MILLYKEEKTGKKEALFSCVKNAYRTSHQLRLVLFGGLIPPPGQFIRAMVIGEGQVTYIWTHGPVARF